MDLSDIFAANPYNDPGMSVPGQGPTQGFMPPMGLMGKLNAALAPYGGLMNVGMQMMANSGPSPVKQPMGALLGKSMLQARQGATQNEMEQMQLAQLRMALGRQAAINGVIGQMTGQGGQGAPASAPASQASGGLLNMPQASAGGQPAAPSAGTPTPAAAPDSDISSIPIAGMSPDLYRKFALLNGKDPLETEKEIRGIQLQTAQQRAQPALDTLDTVIKSDKPAKYVKARPELAQQWAAVAPALGLDPAKDFNDQNVRIAFGFARNQLAGSAQLPFEAPVTPLQTVNGPLGSIYQREASTGKLTQVKGEEDLKQVIDPSTGQPTLLPASQAAGKTPFNQSLFGAANMSDQAIQFAADTYRTTGKMPASMGRNPAMQAKVLDKVAADAAAGGDTAGAIAARQASLKANGQALDQVTKLESATNGYAATLEKNLTNLEAAYKKAGNAGVPLVTRAMRAWQQNISGDPDTASMVTWLNAVQGEYAKLKSGNLGNAPASDSAMRDAKEVINKAMNEGGIAAVSQAMREEAANRKAAIAEQKQNLVGSLGFNAPAKTTPAAATKPLPTGAKLDAYAKAHFGGDVGKATEFLKTQGFQ